jgi:hypothetical protein
MLSVSRRPEARADFGLFPPLNANIPQQVPANIC